MRYGNGRVSAGGIQPMIFRRAGNRLRTLTRASRRTGCASSAPMSQERGTARHKNDDAYAKGPPNGKKIETEAINASIQAMKTHDNVKK